MQLSPNFSVSLADPEVGSKPILFYRPRTDHKKAPSIDTNPSLDGLLVEVEPLNQPKWLGRFSFGAGRLSNLYAMPSEKHFCVVSKGDGYIVNANDPGKFEIVKCVPVNQVYTLLMPDLIIFSDYSAFSAYSPDGLIWVSRDISWDGISDITLDPESITGKGWSAPQQKWIPFKIRISDGQAEGGAAPPK